ncbi:MAG: PTS sugar transporter subunit IIA [Hyphomicrobiaceae bacterium]
MDLGDLLKPEQVIPSLRAKNKKQLLLELALRASAGTGIGHQQILETLLQRESLGSTGIGKGVAIPHARLSGIDRIFCVFARLEDGIDFDASDREPVDLVFLLLAPEGAGADHLKALARISRLLREPETIENLRSSKKRAALYSILTEPLASSAA